jgi:hypothetical protein
MKDDEIEALKAALAEDTKRYRRADKTRSEAGKAAMDKAIQLLRAGLAPAEVTRLSPFTDAYIRRAARVAGIPPARNTGYAKTKDEDR